MASAPNNTSATFTPLHYGGSISPKTGKLGQKPAVGQQFKARRRMETMARLENSGFTKQQISPMLGISVNRVSVIMKSPEYLNIRIAITHGIVVDHEANLATIKAQRKEMLTQLLPPALQIIANQLQQPANSLGERKHQAALAQDLMDREGTFAKVSRTEIKPVDHFDFESADQASRSILNTIRSIAPPASDHSKEAISANVEFSNSKTISVDEQQRVLKELEDAAASGEFSSELLEILPTAGGVN